MTIEMWDTERPIDYPKNARKWSHTAVEKVAASIKAFGFRQPLVVDSYGVICIGHLRREAARFLKLPQVPVHVASDLTAAQIRALRVAENRSHENAEWDFSLLGPEMLELSNMPDIGFDFSAVGFDAEDLIPAIDELLGKLPKKAAKKGKSAGGYKEQYGVIVVCEGEEEQQSVFEKLTADGLVCKIVVT